MGRFLAFVRGVAALAACFGIAVIGVACGGEGSGDFRRSRIEGTEPGDCEDNADNDADGLFDCADPSCEASPLCDAGAGGTSGTGGVAGAGGTAGGGGAGGSMLCADVDCDDQNECTTDACDPADGECDYTNVTTGMTCDFGGLPGVCGAGVCEDAMLCAGVDCDDQNECTTDACDPADGECDYTNVTAGMTCDFGGLPGVCGAGVCEDAMLCAGVDCDDGNECTQDVCDPMDGQCGYTDVMDGTTCDFGGLPGVCTAGTCEDAMLCSGVDCDDGNECTQDVCDPMDGQCGYADVMDGTTCDFGGLPGVCTAGTCEDAMLCAGVDCNDGNECTQDVCDPMDGQCGYTDLMDGTTCDFGGLPGVCDTGTCTRDCVTNALCHTCPDQLLCDTDNDCAFSGYVCVTSGCETGQGAPIKQCQPSRGGSCTNVADCPSSTDYECIPVGAGSSRCVRVTPGCDPVTESYDCAPGFSCEAGTCVDRRVPCDDYLDCPKSHVCSTTSTSNFCVRVYRTCHVDVDCAGFGSFCDDIDGDGTKECAGEIGGAGGACVNTMCSGTAPICEAGATGTTAVCGDYGLCRTNNDCDTGFECVGLWQDGRRECVPPGGLCDQVTDCDPQQVCAAPRDGGPPSCQAGSSL